MEKLYSIFSIIKSNQEKYMKDGIEVFGFLRLELENRDISIIPLKNEILYF